MLPDLRELVSSEQDAECIVFIWRGEYCQIPQYEDGTLTAANVLFIIIKHRNGATNEVVAACLMRRSHFQNLDLVSS